MRWVAGALFGIGIALGACGGPAGPVVNNGPGDAGTGNAGTPSDGGTAGSGGSADAGPADAGPAVDCTGLVPSVGAALTFDVGDSAGKTCNAVTSDGQGMILAESHATGTSAAPSTVVTWNIFDNRGAPQGNFEGGYAIFPQPIGYEGYNGGFDNYWDPYGNPRNFVTVEQRAILVPGYGSGTLAFGPTASGIAAHRIDATGNETGHGAAQVSGSYTLLGGAEDASGAIVVVFEAAGGVRYVWFDLARGTSTAVFEVGRDASEALARPLIGGGVAVRLDGKWAVTLQPNDAQPHSPPAFLRDGSDFAPARGGKAYAVWQSAGNAVDIVSAQGNSCGTMTFSGVSAVSLGADGTVIGASGRGGCTKIFWRGALK